MADLCKPAKICSRCGYLVETSLSVRVRICQVCGLAIDRDQNVARNISGLGLQSLGNSLEAPASGVGSSHWPNTQAICVAWRRIIQRPSSGKQSLKRSEPYADQRFCSVYRFPLPRYPPGELPCSGCGP
ncbi:MAG: transposase [Anaerolineales bacterium]|nr:transposase [Anaerolineales bacterium]